jgi:hypothetical protein
MTRQDVGYMPRSVEQISRRINQDDFKRFLEHADVPSHRAATRQWSSGDTAVLVTIFCRAAAQDPRGFEWVMLDGELSLVMSQNFISHVVQLARSSGLTDDVQRIVTKLKGLAKRLRDAFVNSHTRS